MTTLASAHGNSLAIGSNGFLHRLSRNLLLKMFQQLGHGQITFRENGVDTTCGSDELLQSLVTVHSPRAFSSILWRGSVGAGESYAEGFWETTDLTTLIRIMVLNADLLDDIKRKHSWLIWPARLLHLWLRRNSRRGAEKNISAHYDLGNDMYESFLDPTMMYSSAIYPDQSSSLEEAARYKLDHICRRLEVNPGDRVIEIGSGWGGFAIHAASHYGCHVTTTTISNAQYHEAKKRIAEAGLGSRITLLSHDYRDLEGSYDKLVSIEMIEAVGHKYLPLFFQKCGSLLKPNGTMLLQAITIADQKYGKYLRGVDFIQKHIFPGGSLVANHHMLKLIAEKTDLIVRNIEDFGFDYARTLKDWRKRFLSSFSKLQQNGYDERFKRLWEFYLCYCEGGFSERSISVIQLIAARPQNRSARLRYELTG